jgi:hypothetical protein
MVIKKCLPMFQALFFSSVVICFGTAISFGMYYYLGTGRELRNILLKLTLSLACSWFVFFVFRLFERFCRDWIWVGLAVGLSQMLVRHLNPLCRDYVVLFAIIASQALRFSIPRMVLLARIEVRRMLYAFLSVRHLFLSFTVGHACSFLALLSSPLTFSFSHFFLYCVICLDSPSEHPLLLSSFTVARSLSSSFSHLFLYCVPSVRHL